MTRYDRLPSDLLLCVVTSVNRLSWELLTSPTDQSDSMVRMTLLKVINFLVLILYATIHI